MKPISNKQLAIGNKGVGGWQFTVCREEANRQPPTTNFYVWFLIAFVISLISCNNDEGFPQKPRGYFKIELPQKKYQLFNNPNFPYSFEYPVYGVIVPDSLFFEEKAENPYWINIQFPQFNGELHLSYKEIGKHKIDMLVNDAFKMAYKQHTSRASAIQPVTFELPHNVSGIYFTLKGNAATANQFFATDSVKHFLRGALYFNVPPNEDSLRPVNDFLREDMHHLLNTLRWKQ